MQNLRKILLLPTTSASALITTTVLIMLSYTCDLADTQYVAGVVEAKLDAYRTQFGRDPTVRAAATVTRNLCYANKGGISASFICAGWDAREGSSVFVVDKVGR